jgi:phage gp46-like protein
MSDDRKLYPVTEDFLDEDNGAFELCDAIENKIAFTYLIEAGSWEGDPRLGHGFAELARAKNTPESRNRLRDLAEQAIQWLIDLGEVESVTVTVEEFKADAAAFQVDYYTPGNTRPRRVGPFLIPVGAG